MVIGYETTRRNRQGLRVIVVDLPSYTLNGLLDVGRFLEREREGELTRG